MCQIKMSCAVYCNVLATRQDILGKHYTFVYVSTKHVR